MIEAPIPENEEERLEALKSLGILDTPREEQFDRITRLALKVFKVPISTLTLVDKDREWFKSCQGLPAREGARAISFCGHALLEADMLVIPDTLKDVRFADNPMVLGEPHIRFYAGVPVKDRHGYRLGVFCIKDRVPRELSLEDRQLLKDLASWAALELQVMQMQESLISHESFRKVLERELEESRKLTHLTIDRELDMIRLKKRLKELQEKCEAVKKA
jgi:GAF domain-containing protein